MHSRNPLPTDIRAAGRSLRDASTKPANRLFDGNGRWIVAASTAIVACSTFTAITEHLPLAAWPTALTLSFPLLLALSSASGAIPKRWRQLRVASAVLLGVSLIEVLVFSFAWGNYTAQRDNAADLKCLSTVSSIGVDHKHSEPLVRLASALCTEVAAEHA